MTENELKNLLAAVTLPDEAARARSPRPLGCAGKAFGGLGRLEAMVEDAAALTGDPVPDVSRRAVLVLCADNGVVAQGVSQTDASVTRAVLENLTARRTSVSPHGRCGPLRRRARRYGHCGRTRARRGGLPHCCGHG